MDGLPGPRALPPVRLGAGGRDGDWLPVTTGESGAAVFRGADGIRYAKCVTADLLARLVPQLARRRREEAGPGQAAACAGRLPRPPGCRWRHTQNTVLATRAQAASTR